MDFYCTEKHGLSIPKILKYISKIIFVCYKSEKALGRPCSIFPVSEGGPTRMLERDF